MPSGFGSQWMHCIQNADSNQSPSVPLLGLYFFDIFFLKKGHPKAALKLLLDIPRPGQPLREFMRRLRHPHFCFTFRLLGCNLQYFTPCGVDLAGFEPALLPYVPLRFCEANQFGVWRDRPLRHKSIIRNEPRCRLGLTCLTSLSTDGLTHCCAEINPEARSTKPATRVSPRCCVWNALESSQSPS